MNYYKIVLNDSISLHVSYRGSIDMVAAQLNRAFGLKGISGAIYNPKNYTYIEKIESPRGYTPQLSDVIVE